ncbi:MAG: pilus assembly protein TadG-related protein [Candidatus Dormiibacterota bacterium]
MTAADRAYRRQLGQILPLFALMMVLLLLPVAALAVDGGLILTRHADLAAAAEAAAEAGSQAVDANQLARDGTFQLCGASDGSPGCGNGVGTVQEVVSATVVTELGLVGGTCRQLPAAALGPSGSSGCELALLGRCSGGGPPLGVEVVVWAPARPPILALGPWSALRLTATATSWLAHGVGGPSQLEELPKC